MGVLATQVGYDFQRRYVAETTETRLVQALSNSEYQHNVHPTDSEPQGEVYDILREAREDKLSCVLQEGIDVQVVNGETRAYQQFNPYCLATLNLFTKPVEESILDRF